MKFDYKDFLKFIRNTNEVFLVDYSWMMYRSWYSFDNLSVKLNSGERPTGHIYGMLKTAQDLKERNKNCSIIFCQDGVPEERYEENEEYKSDREHDLDYDIWQDKDIISDMLFRVHDVYFARNPKTEADDVMYALAKKLERDIDNRIYIYSSDNDMLQAISDKVSVVKKVTKRDGMKIVDEDYVHSNKTMIKNFRYCPVDKLPIYRAIVGDSSDNLDGLYRFPRKLATMIAERCEEIEDIENIYFEDLPEERRKPSYEKHLNKCKENLDLLKSNYKIMNLTDDIDINIWRDESEESKQRADEYADKLGMRRYKEFIFASGYKNELGI